MNDNLIHLPVHAIEPDPTCIFQHGALSLWHTPGTTEPVLVIGSDPDPTATHSLSPTAAVALSRALMATQMGEQIAAPPLRVVPIYEPPGAA
jgi:hypothetical protein